MTARSPLNQSNPPVVISHAHLPLDPLELALLLAPVDVVDAPVGVVGV